MSSSRVIAGGPPPLPSEMKVVEDDFILREFRFRSGEVLPELRQHYLTMGTLVRDAQGRATNAVLVLHGTTGSGRHYFLPSFVEHLFSPGAVLDPARWFLILPDALGHGASSKPSDGLKARFPRYDYDDMVLAQHRLLTEGLGIDHLRVVFGISMGGMHSWIWGHRFPDFMEGLFPVICTPAEITGRNRMWRRMAMDMVRSDPAWQGGDYTEQPEGLRHASRLMALMGSGAGDLVDRGPTREKTDQLLVEMDRKTRSRDANDFVYQLDASTTYDPSPHLERIRARVVAVNARDDLMNPTELGMMKRSIRRVSGARFHLMPRTRHGHYTALEAQHWKHHLQGLLEELSRVDRAPWPERQELEPPSTGRTS